MLKGLLTRQIGTQAQQGGKITSELDSAIWWNVPYQEKDLIGSNLAGD